MPGIQIQDIQEGNKECVTTELKTVSKFTDLVQLYVSSTDDAARDLAAKLPSSSSRDFGQPFAKVFKEVKYDFYKIDPMLFAPARVVVTNLATGASFRGGSLHEDLLAASFGEA